MIKSSLKRGATNWDRFIGLQLGHGMDGVKELRRALTAPNVLRGCKASQTEGSVPAGGWFRKVCLSC